MCLKEEKISFEGLHFQTLSAGPFPELLQGYFILSLIPSLKICYYAQYLLCIQYKSSKATVQRGITRMLPFLWMK